MSAPDGRHSLAGMMHETRAHRRDVLQARLDETGADPVWYDDPHDELARELRLLLLWKHSGPGRRDRWALALAGDLDRRGLRGGVSTSVDGVRIEVAGSAAEIVAREDMPRLAPPPPGLLGRAVKAAQADVERTVREAEQVLGRAVKAAPKIGDSIARYLAQQHAGRRAEP